MEGKTITKREEDAKTLPRPRLAGIDFLRGIAILLVLGHHGIIGNQAGRLNVIDRVWHRFGWTGVDLFFVLSGFLVGGLLLQEAKRNEHLDVKRFVIRRSFKIMPSYYIYLLAVFVNLVFWQHLSVSGSFSALALNLVHLQNYTRAESLPRDLPHTWSLAIEEHFYLILPLLLVVLCKRGKDAVRQWTPWICLVAMIACPILRIINSGQGTPISDLRWSVEHQWPTHLRIDSLFCGVLLAWTYYFAEASFIKLTRRPTLLLVCGLVLLSPALIFNQQNKFVWTVGFSLLAWGYALILACIVCLSQAQSSRSKVFDVKLVKGVAFIGRYSYSIYLWHIMIGQLLPKWFAQTNLLHGVPELRWLAVMALYVAAATLVGIIFGNLIEYPALSLRDKLFPSRTASVG